MVERLLLRGEWKVGLFAKSSKKGVRVVLEREKSIFDDFYEHKVGFIDFLSILDIPSIYIIIDLTDCKHKFAKRQAHCTEFSKIEIKWGKPVKILIMNIW
jgi:hypothetical protein